MHNYSRTVLRTHITDHPDTHDLNTEESFGERMLVYPTYVHLTLPVCFIAPTELQSTIYLSTSVKHM